MYRKFFGLKQLPFKITPDLTYFYKHASREDIANSIIYSLSRGDGIVKVVGEVGSGKTTLLRLVSIKLPANIEKVYVTSPNLSPVDFLKLICSELNIAIEKDALKLEVIKSLQIYLIEKHKQGKNIVLLVDEAQSMTIDTLEEIRLLGNLETQTQKLLQIVLLGQPELDVTLNDPMLKPLKDRIANSVFIPNLNAEEVMRYLNSRVQIAGYVGGNLFSLKVAKRIRKITDGLPRSINLLADKLLMAAFSDDSQEIKEKHFIMIGEEKALFKKLSFWLAFLLFISLFSVATLYAYDKYRGLSEKKDKVSHEQELSKPKIDDVQQISVNSVDKQPKKRVDNSNDELQVLTRLKSWKKYWSAQDVDAYLSLYSQNFVSETMNLNSWKLARRANIEKPSYLDVQIANIKLIKLTNGTIESSFLQNYKSDRYFDSVYKKIVWKKEVDGWKIIKESVE